MRAGSRACRVAGSEQPPGQSSGNAAQLGGHDTTKNDCCAIDPYIAAAPPAANAAATTARGPVRLLLLQLLLPLQLLEPGACTHHLEACPSDISWSTASTSPSPPPSCSASMTSASSVVRVDRHAALGMAHSCSPSPMARAACRGGHVVWGV